MKCVNTFFYKFTNSFLGSDTNHFTLKDKKEEDFFFFLSKKTFTIRNEVELVEL